MTASDGLTERLDALEIRIAYQDQVIEDLNAVLTEQWREVQRLAREIARLEQHV